MFTLNDYKSQSFKDLSDYLYNDRLQDFEPIAELEMTDDNLESIFKYRYGIKIFWAIVRMNSYLEQWFKVVSLNQWFPYNYKFRVCADGNIVPFMEENRTVKVYIYAYDEVIETDINTVLVTALTFAIFDHAEENPQNQGVWDNFESIKTLAFTSKCYDQGTYSKMIDQLREPLSKAQWLRGLDLPNLYELAMIWCESDLIDQLDPTVKDYPDNRLGSPNRFNQGLKQHWSSSEYTQQSLYGNLRIDNNGYLSANLKDDVKQVLGFLEL